jgi:hypothetical protein
MGDLHVQEGGLFMPSVLAHAADPVHQGHLIQAAASSVSLEPLRPETLGALTALERKLLARTTFGPSPWEAARIATLGYDGYLEEQLHPEGLENPVEEVLLEALPTLSMSAEEILVAFRDGEEQNASFELIFGTVLRSLYSTHQLYERMVTFWSDHFSIDIVADFEFALKPVDDREVVRPHALGSFPALLAASASSPAMLSYLTNDSNHKDHPNENYARELMELHTLGVDNGYTQEDVKAVARCLTGWSIARFDEGHEVGTFLFRPEAHDTGSKVVLGHDIPAGGGVEDGERVLEILGAHPNTARFLAGKLLNYLWGYEPPQSHIDTIADMYLVTDGDIRAMVRRILQPDWLAEATPKLRRPLHHLAASIRTTGAQLRGFQGLFESLLAAGHLPFTWHPPNGFPDSLGYWSGFLLPRWNAVAQMVAPGPSGVEFPEALGAVLHPSQPARRLVDQLGLLLLGEPFTAPTRERLTAFLEAGPIDAQRVREALGLALASPEFQEY